MSVRKKTALIVIATVMVLMVSLSLIARALMLNSYSDLEAQSIERDVARVQDALSTDIASLNSTTFDYAGWDDTFAFMQGEYPEYTADNFYYEVFDNLRLNLILIADCSGQLVYNMAYDLEAAAEMPVPPGLMAQLSKRGLLACDQAIGNGSAGIILDDRQPILISAQPILKSDRSGPAAGTLVFGRLLNAAEVQRLSEVTHLSSEFIPITNLPADPHLGQVITEISEEKPVVVLPRDEQLVVGYGLIEDLAGEPALILQVETSREIYQQGLVSVKYLILGVLATCLVFGGLTIFQLERIVLRRLALLSQEVEGIGASGDHSARVLMAGQDELTNLSTEINRMLAALEQSEQARRLAERRNLLHAIPDMLFVFNQDGDCLEFKVDQGNQLGLQPDKVAFRNVRDFGFSEEILGRVTFSIQQSLASQADQDLELEYPNDGETNFFDVRFVPLNNNEVLVIARDITDRKRSEEALRESEERYTLAVAGANDGIWDWDLRNNKIYFSPRWKAMLGYAEDELRQRPEDWIDLIHPEDLDQFQKAIDAHLEGLTNHLETELRVMHKDGGYRWMLYRGLAVRHNGSKSSRLAGSQTDTTDRKFIEQQLQHKALHDELTNLPNRTLFMDRLGRALDRARRHPEAKAAVLFLDLDRFKNINDSLGHALGDHLLVAVARRLAASLRPEDTISRFGGDEFGILLEDVRQASDATRVADRIQTELAKPFDLHGRRIYTSSSIGIALTSSKYRRVEDLLRDADIAMYRAKSKGKARYEVFDTHMHTQALKKLEIEADLRQAILQEQFRLHYQPILSLESGEITGVEALLRWQHPERGLLMPVDFLEVAEETKLIVPIGEWVLRAACLQARDWHAAGYPGLRISVNISAHQFQDKNLPHLVKSILTETGLPPQCLEVEITEQTAMQDIDTTVRTLVDLSKVRVQIALDDFGNGYSALGYLKRFPVNSLKIDRSFVSEVTSNQDDAAITSAIIAMAHVLDLKVIAEGVETKDQLKFLQNQRCDSIQGFLISRGLPAEEIVHLLAEHKSEQRAGNLSPLVAPEYDA